MTTRNEIRRRIAALGGNENTTRQWVEQQLTAGTPKVDDEIDAEDIAADFRVFDASEELVKDTSDADAVIIATPAAEFVDGYAVPEDVIPDWIDRDELPVRV